jgi:hypothetical protein
VFSKYQFQCLLDIETLVDHLVLCENFITLTKDIFLFLLIGLNSVFSEKGIGSLVVCTLKFELLCDLPSPAVLHPEKRGE